MSKYNFSALNDKEFESLALELFGRQINQKVERFKEGKDRGVDGRFFESTGECIIQVKHWPKTNVASLIRRLQNEESQKVRRLSPVRYVFITSKELSRLDKEKIRKCFSPYLKQDDDVVGYEDLEDILDRYPDILKKNFKLYLHSGKVLEQMLNNAIIERSRFHLAEISESVSRYVETNYHLKGLERLRTTRSLIITGEAGIGKTTLANNLVLSMCMEGYQLYVIDESLIEAESVWNDEIKQIFFFDDFLGQNYLAAISSRQDSKIVKFMERVKRSKNKLFVLTSRTTILNQAKTLSQQFEFHKTDQMEFELIVKELSPLEKGKILYNHLYHGDLKESYINEIYFSQRYIDVILHANYSPRIIEFITDMSRLRDVECDHYWDHCLENLNNPGIIWEHVLLNQLDDLGRWIVSAVVINGIDISEEDLARSFENSYILANCSISPGIWDAYKKAVVSCVGSVLKRKVFDLSGKAKLALFNPSIGDYVLGDFFEYPQKIAHYCRCLTTSESLRNLHGFIVNNKINELMAVSALNKIVDDRVDGTIEKGTEYYLELIDRYYRYVNSNRNYIELVEIVLEEIYDSGVVGYSFLKCASLCEVYLESVSVGRLSMVQKIVDDILCQELHIDVVITVSNVIKLMGGCFRIEYEDRIRSAVVDYFIRDYSSIIEDFEYWDIYHPDDGCDYDEKFICDIREHIFEGTSIPVDESLLDEISLNCDVQNHMWNNYSGFPQTCRKIAKPVNRKEFERKDIIDLFQRN